MKLLVVLAFGILYVGSANAALTADEAKRNCSALCVQAGYGSACNVLGSPTDGWRCSCGLKGHVILLPNL